MAQMSTLEKKKKTLETSKKILPIEQVKIFLKKCLEMREYMHRIIPLRLIYDIFECFQTFK